MPESSLPSYFTLGTRFMLVTDLTPPTFSRSAFRSEGRGDVKTCERTTKSDFIPLSTIPAVDAVMLEVKVPTQLTMARPTKSAAAVFAVRRLDLSRLREASFPETGKRSCGIAPSTFCAGTTNEGVIMITDSTTKPEPIPKAASAGSELSHRTGVGPSPAFPLYIARAAANHQNSAPMTIMASPSHPRSRVGF